MGAYHVRIIEGGKIVIPAALRRKHGFAVGQTLVVQDSENGVTILFQASDQGPADSAGSTGNQDSHAI